MTWLIVLAAFAAWFLFDALVVWVLWRFGRAREACQPDEVDEGWVPVWVWPVWTNRKEDQR